MNEIAIRRKQIADERYIPYPEGCSLVTAMERLSSGYMGTSCSRFAPHIDFYLSESDDTLTILPRFRTYQQTTGYTCGPCAALMVMDYFGERRFHEMEVAELMGAEPADGTDTESVERFFQAIGWKVDSNLGYKSLPSGHAFRSPLFFRDWVVENLRCGLPIMVEWVERFGHWQVIIGYDRLREDSVCDDALIVADSYQPGGYGVVPVSRFFSGWRSAPAEPRERFAQQWIIARPSKAGIRPAKRA